jgi:hypothetical protein
LKQGDAIPPLLFNFALGSAVLRVQENQDGLKLNGTHQLLVYADGVNMFGGSVYAIKKNAEAFVCSSKETGAEENADTFKYIAMSRDHNVRRNRNMKIDNNSFERVEGFKYLGTALRYKKFIQEEIKSRLKSGNACCHAVQNVLSSSLLSKSIKIKINSTIILLVVLYGCKTWSLTLREEHKLRLSESRVLRIFGHEE